MTDNTLLYVGIFCFAMTVLGLVLTMIEFRKLSNSRRTRNQPVAHKAPAQPDDRLATPRAP
jgi:hypothetical protein